MSNLSKISVNKDSLIEANDILLAVRSSVKDVAINGFSRDMLSELLDIAIPRHEYAKLGDIPLVVVMEVSLFEAVFTLACKKVNEGIISVPSEYSGYSLEKVRLVFVKAILKSLGFRGAYYSKYYMISGVTTNDLSVIKFNNSLGRKLRLFVDLVIVELEGVKFDFVVYKDKLVSSREKQDKVSQNLLEFARDFHAVRVDTITDKIEKFCAENDLGYNMVRGYILKYRELKNGKKKKRRMVEKIVREAEKRD